MWAYSSTVRFYLMWIWNKDYASEREKRAGGGEGGGWRENCSEDICFLFPRLGPRPPPGKRFPACINRKDDFNLGNKIRKHKNGSYLLLNERNEGLFPSHREAWVAVINTKWARGWSLKCEEVVEIGRSLGSLEVISTAIPSLLPSLTPSSSQLPGPEKQGRINFLLSTY